MLNRKKHQIADLETEVRELRQQLNLARRARTAEANTHRFVRQRLAASASTAHDDATRYRRRLTRALYACARYRAQLAQQQPVIDALTEQLFDALDYTPAERALLGLPAAPTAPEVTA